MARWTASAKWGEAPALDGQCATLLGLALSEGLGLARAAYMLKCDGEKADDEKYAELRTVAPQTDNEPSSLGVDQSDAQSVDDAEADGQRSNEAAYSKK